MSVNQLAVIETAINHLRTGWCQGQFFCDPPGKPRCYCLSGAIDAFRDDDDPDAELRGDAIRRTKTSVKAVILKLQPDYAFRGDPITAYNDEPGRTVDCVVGILQKTAKGLLRPSC